MPSSVPAGAMSRATARALRTIASHPSVVDVRVERIEPTSAVRASILIRTELPNAWRAAGGSPSGVRAIEPIGLVFHASFPVSAPTITLRPDFDRGHPHIQPGPPDAATEPCLVAGSPREVVQARTILGLIEQLVEWLDKASALQLNDPRHGWEPVRRDNLDDLLVGDSDRLRNLATPDGGCAAFLTTYLHEGGEADDGFYRVHLDPGSTIPIGAGLPLRFTRRRLGSGEWVGTALALVAWSGRQPDGSPFVAGRYLPETVTSYASLLERASVLGCRDKLEAKLNLLARRLGSSRREFAVPLAVVLLARRPFDLVGATSPVEICAYFIETGAPADLAAGSRKRVRLAGHRETVSQSVLRRASGDAPVQARLPWTLLGCGSVGSKLGLHLARAGRGPSMLVDRDGVEPHNFARHASLPVSADVEGLFFRSKASTLADDLEKLGQKPGVVRDDVLSLLRSEAGRTSLVPANTTKIVNTTGSLVLREALAFSDWTGTRPRTVEACLLGAGRVGYLGVEGPNCNPNASDLAAEAYQFSRHDCELRETVFGAEAQAIAIGQGCSAVSFPLADTKLSMLAATLSDAVAVLDRGGLPVDAGEIAVGRLEPDGLGQRWTRTRIAPWMVLDGAGPGDPTVRVSPRVSAAIECAVAAAAGSETGGVLVGRFSNIGNAFQVVDVLPPPEDSTFSAERFVLGTRGLRTAIDGLVRASGGTLYAVGTWHNHLVPSGPSRTDARTARLLATEQLFPLLMLIHTPGGYAVLTTEAIDRTSPTAGPHRSLDDEGEANVPSAHRGGRTGSRA